MLTDKSNTWDRVFVASLVVAVVGSLIGIHVYASHLRAEKAASAPVPRASKDVLHLEAITNVFECEREGRRILTDRPCGSGVPIRVLPEKDIE